MLLRYACQAFQAPGFPADSSGSASSVASSSNVRFKYSKTSMILVGEPFEASCCDLGVKVGWSWGCSNRDFVVELCCCFLTSGEELMKPSCELLAFLEDNVDEAVLFSALPNQWGNPCRRLNPPGGNLSSSVALTVSELRDPVV